MKEFFQNLSRKVYILDYEFELFFVLPIIMFNNIFHLTRAGKYGQNEISRCIILWILEEIIKETSKVVEFENMLYMSIKNIVEMFSSTHFKDKCEKEL